MEELYQRYIHLPAEQLRLLCFLAYTGQATTPSILQACSRCLQLQRQELKSLLSALNPYFKNTLLVYDNNYSLLPSHQGPLLVYLLCERPNWLRDFDRDYASLQLPFAGELLRQLRLCIMGRFDDHIPPVVDNNIVQALTPLACNKAFLPYLRRIVPGIAIDLIFASAIYQVDNDIPDADRVLNTLAEGLYPRLAPVERSELRGLLALTAFYQRGEYDAEAAAGDTVHAHILYAAHALYRAHYETAFKQLALALRDVNREADPQHKGFFSSPFHNILLVLAYHLHTPDQHKKLKALMNKEAFVTSKASFTPAALAAYLTNGEVPTAKRLQAIAASRDLPHPTSKYVTLLAARFFGIDIPMPPALPPVPRLAFLRHELSRWLPLPDDERQQLTAAFAGEPLLSRIRFKQPWELLLEELTPKEAGGSTAEGDQPTVRVAYVVNYDRVEVREQHLLKSGLWGAGKRMTLDAFRRGTEFMNDADRKIANAIRNWYSYDVDIAVVLPHLVGSDRVYTGSYAPLEPVTIEEEKPYLIIQRTKQGFTLKSNLSNVNFDRSVIYRKDNAHHYTLFTLTDQQRLYYGKLLQIGTFPLEAEPLLRQFLPKVSGVVEVHSDLVEGGSTLQQRDGSPVLCLQVSPTSGARNFFTVYCMARPLPDGITLFDPAMGLNPCVAEADGTRYQVTRDMRGERENLTLLRTFLDDNALADDVNTLDEPFADRRPVILSAEGLLQMMLFVRQQPDHFVIEWPEGGALKLKTADTSSWNISLKSGNGWFEVEGDVPIDDDTILTASQLLQLVGESRQKGFIRLADGEFLAITERLRKQLSRIESLATNSRGHMQISELHATLLGSALNGEIDIHHDDSIERLQKRIEQSMQQSPATPPTLRAELRDYQADGYRWMYRMTSWGAGVCLADDMGLGKTVQTIAYLLRTSDGGPALVAAPASVVLNWRRELERFAPSLNVVVLNSAADRQRAIADAAADDVVLSTYGLFVTEGEHLSGKQWNTVCLDEAHVIKNRETKTSQAAMQLRAAHRIILTGTPVQNNLGELWNLFQFINPGLLGSYDHFCQKYIIPIEQQDKTSESSHRQERSRQLKRIVQPFILRRTKQEVVEELPPKTEVTMPVELTAEEMAVYEVIRRRAKELLEEEAASGSPSINTLAEITRLRQAACAPQLAEKGWNGGESSKITLLLQLIDEIVSGGNSVLVFSQFTSFLALVRKALDARSQTTDHSTNPESPSAAGAGIGYAYLDGSVPMHQRDQLVQDFQRGRYQVFLVSLKAGGLGLNLTAANYVVHLDPWWNPAIEQQATDRAYRIGQRQNVTVYHLISQHTIEEKIVRLHETKRNLADAMLQGTSQSHKLSAQDLLDMLND